MPKFKKDWSEVVKQIKEDGKGGNYKDVRLYKPDTDDDGTAKVILRFLPAPDVDVPFVGKYMHYFRGVGGWFVDNCPTSLNESCPVCEDNSKRWDEEEEYIRKRGGLRKLSYYSNILVVEDKKTPSNEGKVWLFKFGKRIYDKILDAIKEGSIPFDEDAGVNFIFKIKNIKVGSETMPSYDTSHFSETESSLLDICKTKKAVDKVLTGLYPLAEFKDPTQFKSYDELKVRFNKVVGEKSTAQTVTATQVQSEVKSDEVPSKDEAFNEDGVFVEKDDKTFFDNMKIE